ncbi:hypothetical protein BD779DRAFT_1479898 [Infundibulicybe gibba]|nr:hypothetical protein BD779DRAFT_1479898 [Infundibulicybe gibba]
MSQIVCSSPTCIEMSKYGYDGCGGRGFCSVECQLDDITERLMASHTQSLAQIPLPQSSLTPQSDLAFRRNVVGYCNRHYDILGELTALIAGCSDPTQEVTGVVMYLQPSIENEDHFRLYGLQKIGLRTGIMELGLSDEIAACLQLASFGTMVLFVYTSDEGRQGFPYVFPVTITTESPRTSYYISEWVALLEESERIELYIAS